MIKFTYDGYSFVLQMKKVGQTTKTSYASSKDISYNIYNFIIHTGVPAQSPYLTKEAKKEAIREAKGKKKKSVTDLM